MTAIFNAFFDVVHLLPVLDIFYLVIASVLFSGLAFIIIKSIKGR